MIGWVCFRVFFFVFFFFFSHGSRGEVMVFAVGVGVVIFRDSTSECLLVDLVPIGKF